MVNPRIALVVGNGLSMSFGKFSGLSEKWNSQNPLAWEVDCPHNGGPFIEQLPLLKKLREFFPHLSDFDIFKQIHDPATCRALDIHPDYCLIEARHYLTIAFSKLSELQIENFNKDWGWFKWLSCHKENLHCAFSLNYDLLLEQCLDELGVLYTSFENNAPHQGIPLAKPHGSVDFDPPGLVVGIPITYPIWMWFDLNDSLMARLNKHELMQPRAQPLCITPNEANKYTNYHWVKPIRNAFLQELQSCTHCVFIGISYFDCDRPELDEIVRSLPDNAEIIVANPDPNKDFIETLGKRPVTYWKSYNSPLDDITNEPMMLKMLPPEDQINSAFLVSDSIANISPQLNPET